MLKRKVYKVLQDWKLAHSQKCLVLKGARQVGKTYIVEEFGQDEYDSFLKIDFLRQPALKDAFSGDLTADEILKRISAYSPDFRLVPGSTLIFLDEIQKCAAARTSLKYLAQDERFDVIASGSLLGLRYGDDADPEVEQVPSIPVGYEEQVIMHSLDFEEYLWALGYGDDTVEYLRSFFDSEQAVPDGLNQKYLELVREYMIVGGMPEVVAHYVQNKNFGEVQHIQETLIAGYEEDIAQHAKGREKVKVQQCFQSVPNQLARENRKFKYSAVEKKATSRKFGDSIQWLIDANMVLPCYNVEAPILPLKYNRKENEFKIYLHDTGLLMSMYGLETKLALLNGSLKGNGKGGIFENFVAETLVKRGYTLSYYRPNQDYELEFLVEKQGEVVPIEVKAGNTATKSLNRFIEDKHPAVAYKVIDGNLGRVDTKLTVPHYMAMFL